MAIITFYILSCGFAFCILIFALSYPLHAVRSTLFDTRYASRFTRYKIRVNLCNPRLINNLRSTKSYVRKNNLFLQNEPNFRTTQMNVNTFITKNYEQRTMNYEVKNKANSKPNKPNSNPILANKIPKQSQYKPNPPCPKSRWPLMEQLCYG